MTRAMLHRGPAHQAQAACAVGRQSAVLGFCGTAAPDVIHAATQPLAHARSGDVIAFDGYLTNARALRNLLRATGHVVVSEAVVDVALHSLVAWGESALERFEGGYALAFAQAGSGRILLARDALGIKPLYVAVGSEATVFASEVRGVLASELVADDLDPAGLATMLAYGAVQEPLTAHRHVRAVGAGSAAWLVTGAETPTSRRFWRFPRVIAAYDRATAASRLQTALDETVAGEVSSQSPLSVFLSDGIGSGLVAALARQHAPDLETCSLGFAGNTGSDGLVEAAATARALHTRHREIVVDDDWIAAQWDDWSRAADAPTVGGLEFSIMAGVARETETQLALTGIAANELFGVSPRAASVRRLSRWAAALRMLPRRLRPIDLAAGLLQLTPPADVAALGLSPHGLGLTTTFLPADIVDECAATDDLSTQVCRLESVVRLTNGSLRDADVFGMSHALELRSPFAVKSIVDLALSMPKSMKGMPNAAGGGLLRKAAGAYLPYDAIVRDDRARAVPFARWLHGPVRDQAEAAIAAVCGCPLLSSRAVRERWDAWLANPSEAGITHLRPLLGLGSYLVQRRRA